MIDYLSGVGSALNDNMFGGSPVSASPGYVDAYNSGRTAGHYLSMAVGAAETVAGGLGLLGSGVAEVGSLGTATPAVVVAGAGSIALAGHGLNTANNAVANLTNDKGKVNATSSGSNSTGRGSNHLKPDSQAKGDHSTFRTDPKTGKTSNTATYKENPKNPKTGFQEVKRVDVTGASHRNSKTGQEIKTPHVHEPKQKDPRPARPDELPRQN